jgi:mitosis inhibitor protein kinase SWE1
MNVPHLTLTATSPDSPTTAEQDMSDVKTPTPSPGKSRIITVATSSAIYPRLSLPAFAAPKQHRALHHRQSHPAAPSSQAEEDDVFEKRFIVLDTVGKGAFSTVLKVQERDGDGLFAVKKARGVFDGVKDRSVLKLHVSSPF